jgi:hypothetical protein
VIEVIGGVLSLLCYVALALGMFSLIVGAILA